ncbi:sulfurtransferase [Allopontixanthobacter sediminis]|uniref:Sulfurtransferase n=1 Tax=Allopontixanthobacter sediminis TaxID=1689985 RepID=A0A845B4B3_9SPHN|nr:sulfurtransferase [Allopontixanthobacter sediminis]MXP45220.1 sulfurtransferase [Allopontixanthobacter sediminis]
MNHPANTGILVSTEQLAETLGEDRLIILDASAHLPDAGRNPAAEFAASHISGARFLDLPDLIDKVSPVPAALPRADQFEQRMRNLGVTSDSRIVLYDDSKLRSSARAWFICRMFGLQNVAVLDGGLAKWKAEGRPVESGQPSITATDFTATADDREWVRSKADMLANIDNRSEQVLDARDAQRFTGEIGDQVHDLPGGHIPGALNLPFPNVLNEDGTFKRGDSLRAAFEKAGVDLSAPVTGTCGSGMTASVLLFALKLLGKENIALYDGSWSEWGADPATPKEIGAPSGS